MPGKKQHTHDKAVEVTARKAAGETTEALAEEFGMSVPTINTWIRQEASFLIDPAVMRRVFEESPLDETEFAEIINIAVDDLEKLFTGDIPPPSPHIIASVSWEWDDIDYEAIIEEVFPPKTKAHLGSPAELKQVAGALGVPATVEHCEQRIAELNDTLENMTQQRDAFEKKLHAETDAYNKCYKRAETLEKENIHLKGKRRYSFTDGIALGEHRQKLSMALSDQASKLKAFQAEVRQAEQEIARIEELQEEVEATIRRCTAPDVNLVPEEGGKDIHKVPEREATPADPNVEKTSKNI